MGKLTLKLFTPGRDGRARQDGSILQRLRSLRATLVHSTVEGAGDDAVEIYEFATTGLAPTRPAQRSPHLIRSLIEQQERLSRLEAIAQLGRGLVLFSPHNPKEVSMPTPLRHPLVLGKFEPEPRRLFDLARRLVRGEGPPEELRMPNPVVTVVPNGHRDAPPRNAWGIAGIGVGLEMDRPYPPIEAMVVSGYVLFGLDWPATFKKLRLPASLERAYIALEQHFTDRQQKPPDALVTIPKPNRAPRGRVGQPAIQAQRSSQPALPPPERPKLTHQSTSSTALSATDLPATRVR